MNVERILALADHLQALKDKGKAENFNMNVLARAAEGETEPNLCKTTLCLAGYTVMMDSTPEEAKDILDQYCFKLMDYDWEGRAKWVLDINNGQARDLFFKWDASIDEAIDTLRRFARTGYITWTQEHSRRLSPFAP